MVTELRNIHRAISSCDMKLMLTEWWNDSVSTEWHCIYRVSNVYQVWNYVEWLVWTEPLLLPSAWWCWVVQWMLSITKSPSQLLEPEFLHLGWLGNIGVNLCFGWPYNYDNWVDIYVMYYIITKHIWCSIRWNVLMHENVNVNQQ